MKNVKITDDLIRDLERYGSNISIGMATQVRDELTDIAEFAIDEFYRDYDPVYYKRHFYNFKQNSFEKYYKNPHNSIVRGGVSLSPFNMDDIYKDNTEDVFDMVYHGFHGVASGFYEPKTFNNVPRVMSPSPLEIIIDKQNEIVKHINKYKKYGLERAKKDNYNTLSL